MSGGSVRIVNPIGSTLQQRYQILEQLGHNGSVTTYLAIDLQVPGNLQLKCAVHCYQLADTTPDSPDWNRAVGLAQALYDLSRTVDRLPIVYSYFIENRSFYIVREFVTGVPLFQELSADPVEVEQSQPAQTEDRAWTQSQVVMLLADLLEVLRDIERCGIFPDPISLTQIVRRQIDGKLVIMNLPQSLDPCRQSTQPDLRTLGEIAIAAATGLSGADLPLTAHQRERWHQQAPQIDRPELIAIIDRLIATAPNLHYSSIAAAWQAVVSIIPQLLVHQHSSADTRTEIARHVRLLVERGTEFYEVGDCDRALTAYDRAISLDPECVEAYCGRGNARRYLGEYTDSWHDFDTAIQLDPDRGVAYVGRGLAASFGSQSNSNSNPHDDFELGKNLLANPTSAIEYVMRGTAKAQLRDDRGAIADYDIAISLNRRLLVAYNNRGNLHQYLGDFDTALADFSQVLEIDPQSAIAYNNRAIIYTQIGQLSTAIADYQRAIELQPNFVSVYNNLGNTYCQMGDFAAAIAQYSQAIALDSEFAVAYSNRANIHRIQDRLTTALADYDRAIDLDPNLVIAHYNRGICYRQVGNHQAAIDSYTRTLALDREYFYAYYHRGNARQYLGDNHGAIADYTHTICFDPNHLHAYYNRSITRNEIGDIQGAIDDLDRAIELSPEFALAYYQRGWLLSTDQQYQAAIVDYQQAIALKPDYLDAHYHRGCSYQSLGDLSAALEDFNRTIDIDANYAPSYFQRGKVYDRLGDRTGAITNFHHAANLYLDRGDSQTYQYILQILDRLTSRG
jgi:tetratricopeptide (TPR) repeat protein